MLSGQFRTLNAANLRCAGPAIFPELFPRTHFAPIEAYTGIVSGRRAERREGIWK